MMAMREFVCIACILVLGTSAVTAGEKANPVQKVISMMNDMMAKAKQEKQDEKVRFAAFSQFCKSTMAQKKKAIDDGDDDVEKASAEIAQAEADVKTYAKEIAGHEQDINTWTADKEKALKLRSEEHAVFQKVHAETVDNLESTEAAQKTLEEGNKEQGQAALLQLSQKSKVPKKAKNIIASFLQFDPAAALLQDEVELANAPQAAAYEGSSGAIIEVVEGLHDKLSDEKKELEEREANGVNAHNLQVNSLTGDIKKANMESEMKTSIKAEREQDRAEAKGDLADATRVRAEDEKFLADLNAECELKATDFQKRQVMRKGEIEAIEKAIEIMSSPDVAGGVQHTSLTQQSARKTAMLAQLRSGGGAERHPAQHIAATFLADRARKMNSQVLSLLAMHASSDPFAKVTKMIKNMIKKLMEEANEEAEHKGFCDTEMGTNKLTRDTKTALVAELQAKIEQLSADIMELAQTISKTIAAIEEIDAGVSKATEERQAEQEKNQQTIEDGKTAQAATQKALQVLKEYYEKAANQVDLPEADGPIKYDPRSLAILSKASGGAALLQNGQKVPGAPEMESGKYTGMENGGVVGMLEIIESDFSDLIAETSASEAEAARVYEQFMNDSNQDKAVKNTELKHKEDKKVEKESDLQEARVDLMGAQKELQAAVDYFEKLKPSCVEVAVSYEDRVAAREEEIQSLQEAMKILSQDDIA